MVRENSFILIYNTQTRGEVKSLILMQFTYPRDPTRRIHLLPPLVNSSFARSASNKIPDSNVNCLALVCLVEVNKPHPRISNFMANNFIRPEIRGQHRQKPDLKARSLRIIELQMFIVLS